MKKIFSLLLVLPLYAFGQFNYVLNFDATDTMYQHLLQIDTVNCRHNNWQIGATHKPVFASAYSFPNAIMTDTVNPYQAYDTSIFIIKVPTHPMGITMPFLDIVNFWYQLDIDTQDRASIELSLNNGLTWRDILKDSSGVFDWTAGGWGKPNFDSSTHGWNWFNVTFIPLYDSMLMDTVIFRYTFTSLNNSSHKDGWIMDDIYFQYLIESQVKSIENQTQIIMSPNPTTQNLNISSTQPITQITITNLLGQTLYNQVYNENKVAINVADLPTGVYFIKINNVEVRRFVKQ